MGDQVTTEPWRDELREIKRGIAQQDDWTALLVACKRISELKTRCRTHESQANQAARDLITATEERDRAKGQLIAVVEALSELYGAAFMHCGTASPNGTTWATPHLQDAGDKAKALMRRIRGA